MPKKDVISDNEENEESDGEEEKMEVYVNKNGALVIYEGKPDANGKVDCWQLAERDYAGKIKKEELKLLGKFILADP